MKSWVGPSIAVVIGTMVGVTILLAAVVLSGPPGPLVAPQCPPDSGTVMIDGTPYWCIPVPLDWNNTVPGVKLNVTSHFVIFQLDWYSTLECPVVNVAGHEANGANYTLFVIPNCAPSMPVGHGPEFPGPNYFSPDRGFGATWVSYSSIQLYVRAAVA